MQEKNAAGIEAIQKKHSFTQAWFAIFPEFRMDLNRYKKNLPKRREAGTWLEPRRYEKEIYLLERLALEPCFQKCFAVSGLFIEKQWRLFFTSFVVDKISIRENCDQNVYTG